MWRDADGLLVSCFPFIASISKCVCVCVCVCVREREREREGVCECVCVCERECYYYYYCCCCCFLRSCITDMCECDNGTRCFCVSILAYVRACTLMGFDVQRHLPAVCKGGKIVCLCVCVRATKF